MLRRSFFQHALRSFNTDFFISRKLLTEVNNQLDKTHRPIPANSKRLSSREGSVQCVAANEV